MKLYAICLAAALACPTNYPIVAQVPPSQEKLARGHDPTRDIDQMTQLTTSYQIQTPDSEAAIRLQKLLIKKKQSLTFGYEGPDRARKATIEGNAVLAAATSPVEYEHAAQLFVEAMHLEPWWSEPILGLATARDRQGNAKLALLYYDVYLFTGPAEPDALLAQVRQRELQARQGQAGSKP